MTPVARARGRFGPHLLTAAFLAAALLAGCGGSDNKKNPVAPGGGSGGSSTFTGIFASGGNGGRISLTIQATVANLSGSISGANVSAAGVIAPDNGAPIALAGTYDPEADTLHVAGPGFVFSGSYDSTGVHPGMLGSYASAAGDGLFACFLDTGAPIHTFVGLYVNDAVTAGGRWNMMAVDTVLVGAAFPDGGTVDQAIGFEGTVARAGALRAIAISATTGAVSLDAGGTWDTGTNAVAGTWNVSDSSAPSSDSGTWTGALAP